MSTNEAVPIKFEGRGNQRRFMIMEANENFTREKSDRADQIFTKFYGYDAFGDKVGPGLIEDKAAIEQFKHDLWIQKNAEGINYRKFPHTSYQ